MRDSIPPHSSGVDCSIELLICSLQVFGPLDACKWLAQLCSGTPMDTAYMFISCSSIASARPGDITGLKGAVGKFSLHS